MEKLVDLQGNLLDNQWEFIEDEQPIKAHGMVSVKRLTEQQAELLTLANTQPLGLFIKPEDNLDGLDKNLNALSCICVDFPVFTDGRGYTSAHILREQLHYKGSLRAVGDVLLDQLFYMKRCGFDQFSLRQDQKLSDVEFYLNCFSDHYQNDAIKSTQISHYRASIDSVLI